jgi:membrane associated rhomboid family serine protease
MRGRGSPLVASGRVEDAKPGGSEPEGALRRRLGGAPMTVTLVGLCWGVFVATLGLCLAESEHKTLILVESTTSMLLCRDAMLAGGALELGRVWVDGQWWRVGSTGLQHGSWLHVILNTWSLWVVGEWAEAAWGRGRLLLLFVVSSLLGCLASLGWAEAPMVVGASAGVLGIAGALLMGRLLGRGALGYRLRPISAGMLGGTLAILLAIGFFVPVIAQAGHIGGLVVGCLLGLAWSGRGAVSQVVGWVGVASVAALLGVVAQSPDWRPGYHEFQGHRLLERGEPDEAMAAFEQALRLQPDEPALANAVAYSLALAGVELERAETLVRSALAVEPENADYLDTLGWIHCRSGRVEEGLAELERAREAADRPVPEIEEHIETCAEAEVSRETSGR